MIDLPGRKLAVARCVIAAAVAWGLLSTGVTQAAPAPFRGQALWISQMPTDVTPTALAQSVRALGVGTLYVKAGDGSTADPQFTPALVRQLNAGGVSVCGWTFIYGAHPQAEAGIAADAAKAGARCLVVDAEGQYDGRYSAAQRFVHDLRASVGSSLPIGLAGQAEISRHQTFPYSVFLGPGAFNADLPQIYWRDFGVSVDQAFRATVGPNAIYGRPILPVGQLYGSPTPAELRRFRSLARADGCPGLSFFSLDAATSTSLSALSGAPPAAPPETPVLPTIKAGADGDEIVWAQELLDGAGATLPVGGYFGAETAQAVAAFQSHHHLSPSGALTPATWRDLMRYRPRQPSWAKAPPQSARGGD